MFFPSLSAAADTEDIIQPGEERLTVNLGAFLSAFGSKLQLNNSQGTGDRIDLARDLGLEQDSSGVWAGAEWRFAPRHRLGFTFTRFTLHGERTLDHDLHVGDQVLTAGSTVVSQLRLETVPITYSYSMLKREHDELAFTAGLHWSRLNFARQRFVPGSAEVDREAKADLPLPLLGLRYEHNFSRRWSAAGSVAAFALKFGQETTQGDGSLVSARLSAEYRFSRHVAAGAALDAFRVNINLTKGDWNGSLEYAYWGPQAYLITRF